MFVTASITAAILALLVAPWISRCNGRAAIAPASVLGRLAVVVTWLSLTVMTITAYAGMLRFGELRGWLLLAHTAVAPVFLAALAAASILPIGRATGRTLLLVSGAVSASAILAAMSPWFGYSSQVNLIAIHRYSAVALLASWVLLSVGYVSMRPVRTEESGK